MENKKKKKKKGKSEKLSEPRGHDNHIQRGSWIDPWTEKELCGKMRNPNKIWKLVNTDVPMMVS